MGKSIFSEPMFWMLITVGALLLTLLANTINDIKQMELRNKLETRIERLEGQR